ncbi:MAG: hypothetical protein OXG72_18220 [Acidobacteria bacterium]|nr:hypothetical protein [Acidobacteriota bacterium]
MHGRAELVVAGVPAAREEVGGWGAGAPPGDGIDGAGERVGAVQARERAADHLDLLDGLHLDEVQLGQRARAQVVGGEPVHQKECPFGARDAAQDQHRVGPGGHPRALHEIDARGPAQQVLQIAGRRRLDGLRVENRDAGRDLGDRAFGLRRRHHDALLELQHREAEVEKYRLPGCHRHRRGQRSEGFSCDGQPVVAGRDAVERERAVRSRGGRYIGAVQNHQRGRQRRPAVLGHDDALNGAGFLQPEGRLPCEQPYDDNCA